MAKAEKLAETDRRDAKQNEELSTLLSSVRTEIEMAQILGYGKKADFKPIFDQVKSIEQKSAGGIGGSRCAGIWMGHLCVGRGIRA